MNAGELPPPVVEAVDNYRAALKAERAAVDKWTGRRAGTSTTEEFDKMCDACRVVTDSLKRLRAACDAENLAATDRHEVECSVWGMGR